VRFRRLGLHGPRVSAIGLGRGSRPLRPGDPLQPEFDATVRRAVELGVNFFDTADGYWGGQHELLLGQAIRDFRGEVLIASKFGNVDLPGGGKAVNGRPEYVMQACEASLRRLGVETIDLYYVHRVDRSVPIEETIGAMVRLKEQGKVRHLGLCEASAETLRRAHAVHPLAALQSEYSLWYRGVEEEILPLCRELGIGFVPYAPLGRGLLTGRIRSVDDLPPGDRRRTHPRFLPGNLERNVALVRSLEAVAARRGATAAQVALAWLLAQGEDIVPIPGTNRVSNLEQNVAAVEIALSQEELRELAEVFAPGAGAGERYDPELLEQWGM
jgi:aryl-alcohol dehydrogenase-like predicted oxidoreductase